MEILIKNGDFNGFKDYIKQERKNIKDEEMVIARVDYLTRVRGLEGIKSAGEKFEEFARNHIAFTIQLMKSGSCSKGLPIYTLQDMLEVSSIECCKVLFSIVEDHMVDFKQPPLSDIGHNTILRFCNDLLRRLSRTAETQFCGRIMFFLSRYLPLSEKSGLNLMSHFNTQNITVFEETDNTESLIAATSTVVVKEDEEMETGEIDDSVKEIHVSPEMYRQFWSLQKFMVNPNLLYEKDKYLVYKKDLSAVLSLFSSNKLEKTSQEDEEMEKKSKREKLSAQDLFFSKYLTSPKLLALQLNDSQFRRYFLLQQLIILQYLVADVKFKTVKIVLNEEQLKFVAECEEKCYKLLSETMPRGSSFTSCCKKILQRETEWSNWKNQVCPDYTEKADKAPMQMYKKRVRVPYNAESIDLGTPELNKLWNYETNTLEFLKSKKRKFAPKLAEFLQDPLDEMDPEQQVEEQYKSINDPSFQWKAARLLMRKSPIYIGKIDKINEPLPPVKEFLEKTIYNTAKNMEEFKAGILAREEKEAVKNKEEQESLRRKLESTEAVASPSKQVDLTDEQLDQWAELLKPCAKKLGNACNFKDEEIEARLKDSGKEKEFCLKCLNKMVLKHGKSGKVLLQQFVKSDTDLAMIAASTFKKIVKDEATS